MLIDGFSVSDQNCVLKFRNLMQTYKANKLKEESGRSESIHWEYYETFKNAFESLNSDQCSLNGKHLVS